MKHDHWDFEVDQMSRGVRSVFRRNWPRRTTTPPCRLGEVVVTGSHTAIADFRHYVTKHRPIVAFRIVGWEIVDHPTEGQLVALAKKYFMKYDQMVGTRTIRSTPDSPGAASKRAK